MSRSSETPAFGPEQSRLESLAEFAAGAGHELNNPIATIVGRVQLLLADEADPERRKALATIGGQAYRIRDMIGDLMLFARPPRPEPKVVDLAELAAEVAVRPQPADGDELRRRVEIETNGAVPVWADPTQLSVVIDELVSNSLEATRDGGTVTVGAVAVEHDGRRWGRLDVADTGSGLDETDRQHLFDPFYSGRQAGRGLGFGLPKCWRIVDGHRGRIDVETPEGGGVIFRVFWPAEPPGDDDAAG